MENTDEDSVIKVDAVTAEEDSGTKDNITKTESAIKKIWVRDNAQSDILH